MAVNPQKLLPPARLSPAERMAAAYDKKIDDLLNIKIKKKLINVEKVLNKTSNSDQIIRVIKGNYEAQNEIILKLQNFEGMNLSNQLMNLVQAIMPE